MDVKSYLRQPSLPKHRLTQPTPEKVLAPRPLADAIARVHRRLPGRGRSAQIRTPCAVARSSRRRERLTVLIGAGESTEIRPVTGSGAGDEKTHLVLLRRDQGCDSHKHGHPDCA